MTKFVQLNDGWNAEPNAPHPKVTIDGDTVRLDLTANGFQFPDFAEEERVCLIFRAAQRYRLGPTNDEGWYKGQCRFSQAAPAWGEFYEVQGDLKLDEVSDEWHHISDANDEATNHYLFYLRDETFECSALSWELRCGQTSQNHFRSNEGTGLKDE